jgi:predicted ATPase with chaperone activity
MMTEMIPEPQSCQQTGVPRNLLQDLALKTLYLNGEMSLHDLAGQMRLSLGVVDELFQRLRKDQLCEVRSLTAGIHNVTTTSLGKTRALELLALNQYTGPAPVSLEDYKSQIRKQSIRDTSIGPADVENGFRHLVLSQETLTQIGTAAVSGTSIFIYGPPGTGKTAIAETLPSLYQDAVWLPHAVEVDGQIITLYDAAVHRPVEGAPIEEQDSRWVWCKRPRIVAGGELTIDMLDLQFNPVTKFYAAPLQMKANSGVLIIDDFGRQRMRPEEMLNRWIVPLDRRIDFLTLIGGKKFEIPFDLFVAFATNLEPAKLADEAFLRRISNKIKMDYVEPPAFHQIFRDVCGAYGLEYSETVVAETIHLLEETWKQPLRACYPRDLALQITWAARYEGKPPQLDMPSIRQACHNYFVSY